MFQQGQGKEYGSDRRQGHRCFDQRHQRHAHPLRGPLRLECPGVHGRSYLHRPLLRPHPDAGPRTRLHHFSLQGMGQERETPLVRHPLHSHERGQFRVHHLFPVALGALAGAGDDDQPGGGPVSHAGRGDP